MALPKVMSVVLAGGGTAGHIEPAMAVADALRDRLGEKVRITALGTSRGLETSVVPARGYDLRLISPVPIPRKPTPKLLGMPLKIRKAVMEARDILAEVEADVLIGFGGYVSAPAYLAARMIGIPFFVHEANARAGMANKLGVKLGGTGLNAVPDSGLDGEVVGIPIRKTLNDPDARERGRELWGLDEQRSTLLVTGGSQGAKSLNDALADALDEILERGYQVLHAYGKKNEAPEARDGYVPVPYIEDMAAAYGVADMIICRSGAMTVAEVTAASVPAVYVPLPHGNGEQGLNAGPAVDAGAARILEDKHLNGAAMVRQVDEILGNVATYNAMRHAATRTGAGHVADNIAERLIIAVRRANH